jgi:branched-chain amino acid transport system permease protein
MDGVGLPWWQAVSIAIVFGLVQGIVIQQAIIRPLIGGPVLSAIIATLGLNIVLNSVAGMIWGHQTYTFPSPFAFSAPFMLGGVPIAVDSVVNILVGLVIIVCMTLFLRFTWIGLGLRAASQNQTVARLMGVSITGTSAIAWGLGGMVGAIAGVLVAPSLFLDTNLMGALLIKAFAGGVLGGLNSLVGVFLGCLALGVAENLAGAYVSPSFAEATTFLVIIAVLVLRPEGIFGRVKVQKA